MAGGAILTGRDWYVNGPALVSVKGNVNTQISQLTQFGLSDEQISVTPEFRYLPIKVNAWGQAPPEVQNMLSMVTLRMSLVHFDRHVLDVLINEAMCGVTAVGTMPMAGSRLGNNAVQFAAGNHFVQVCLFSPIGNRPWRFHYCYLSEQPFEFPLGTERSIMRLTFQCIPYTIDPWNDGAGSLGALLWDHQVPS